MPRPRLRYVQREVTRHGKVVWYFRRDKTSPRHQLPGDYYSPEFIARYNELFADPAAPAKVNRGGPAGTLAWLWAEYRKSADWSRLAPATRRQRENIMLHVLEKGGHAPYEAVTKRKIMEARDARQATPAAANNFLKTMSGLFTWAVEAEYLDRSPVTGVKKLELVGEGHTPWTVEDVALYRARWPIGTRQRVALEVYVNTGLRRGDACRVGRQNLDKGVLTIVTEKSRRGGKAKGVSVHVPLLPCLQEAIAAGPVGDLVFIVGERGQPYTKESLGNMFREWCDLAGVTKSAHGIRKLCAAKAADGGATEKELQALFGWTTNEQSGTYTASANNKRLAYAAAMKLLAQQDGD
jgi:integrase